MPEKPETNELIDGGQSEDLTQRKAVLLTNDNPMEAVLLDYAKQINQDTGLTNAEQIELVRAVVQDLPYARHYLTEGNRGFLATVAYPFRAHSYDNTGDLMDIAGYGLLEAALRFDPKITHNFLNFAAPIVQGLLVQEFPWAEQRKLLIDEEEPIYTIIRFASNVKEARSKDELARKTEQDSLALLEEPTTILREHADILKYIHLPNAIIRDEFGITESQLYRVITDMCQLLGVENRSSLALLCVEAGIDFEVGPIPDTSSLRSIELAVAPLLHLRYEEVARIVGITEEEVNTISTRLRKKFGARSRTELVLMTAIAEIEPVESPLKRFTAFERKVLPYLHLKTDEIMSRTGLSENAVNAAINRAAKTVGVDGRRSLALYLYNEGFDFEISKPKRPLVDVLDSDQMTFAKNLHLTDEELRKLTGLSDSTIHSNVYRFSKRLGARNRVELMLMAHMYDTGERREPDQRTKQEKLASKLGWGTLDIERLQRLLDSINDKQRTLVEAYYLSDEDVSWRAVSNEHNIPTTLAIVTARAGILRMRDMSENSNAESVLSEQ